MAALFGANLLQLQVSNAICAVCCGAERASAFKSTPAGLCDSSIECQPLSIRAEFDNWRTITLPMVWGLSE